MIGDAQRSHRSSRGAPPHSADDATGAGAPATGTVAEERGIPLLASQASFLHDKAPVMVNPNRWNLCMVYRLPPALGIDLLRAAVTSVWRHHDALRVRFRRTDGSWSQSVAASSAEVPFRHVDLSRIPDEDKPTALEEVSTGFQHTLHLEAGPLIRFVHYDLGSGEPARLFIVVHHLVADSVSLSIMIADLESALRSLLAGRAPRLRPNAHYGDCARALAEYARSPALRGELPYWLDQEWSRVPDLPTDAEPYSDGTVGSWTTRLLALDGALSDTLVRRLPAATGLDLNAFLVGALAETATEWSGGPVCLLLVHHGRDLTDAGAPVLPPRAWRTMGWFSFGTSVILEPRSGATALDHLHRTAQCTTAAPNHGAGLGLLHWLAPTGAHAPALAQAWSTPGIMYNNFGNRTRRSAREQVLSPSNDAVGHLSDPLDPRLPLHVAVRIRDGVLSLQWDFDPFLRRPETVARLLERMRAVLRSYAEEVLG